MAADCVCASAIGAELNEWVRLGGGNSGCCGNQRHTYGFHCAASRVPVTDYSRRHEAAPPYRMNWASAGDFHHGYNPKLMALHATVLTRLMAGELPMICEMITKPWKDKPVYYWARWNGVKTLQRYTGAGHDHWSHISWWRSRANERAYLWTPPPTPALIRPAAIVTAGTIAPKYPGYLIKPKATYDANVRIWQAQIHARGSGIKVDGFYGPSTVGLVKLFQKTNRLGVDGIIGPKTWKAAWVRG